MQELKFLKLLTLRQSPTTDVVHLNVVAYNPLKEKNHG
jgi:hypothetical protein